MSQGAIPAKQARSQETHSKLLSSLENLLRQKSFEEISISEIAEGAGVAPATIYRRFKNKDAFIPVMWEIYLQRLEDWSASEAAALEVEELVDLRSTLQVAAKTVWAQLQDQAHIMRAIYLYAHIRPDLIGPEWKKWEQQSLNSFRALIDHFEDEVKREDKDLAAKMIAYFFNSIYIEYGLYGTSEDTFTEGIDKDTFAGQIADFAFGYLTLAPR